MMDPFTRCSLTTRARSGLRHGQGFVSFSLLYDIVRFVAVSVPEEFQRKSLHKELHKRVMLSDNELKNLLKESVDNDHSLTYDVIQRQQNQIL